jgi:hypothetical protein
MNAFEKLELDCAKESVDEIMKLNMSNKSLGLIRSKHHDYQTNFKILKRKRIEKISEELKARIKSTTNVYELALVTSQGLQEMHTIKNATQEQFV